MTEPTNGVPTVAERKSSVWKNASIILGTDIMQFLLYHHADDNSNTLFRMMEAYQNRLWMPSQIKLELFNARSKKTSPLDESNPILNKVLTLYEGKVGEEFTTEQLAKIYQTGERLYTKRYPKFKPPMVSEANSSRNPHFVYGDLILFEEMIKFAKTNKTNVIFVTNSRKRNWWYVTDNAITPRQVTMQKFSWKTRGQALYLYQLDEFLHAATTHLSHRRRRIPKKS
jgi:hypothetical protein